MPLQYRKVFNTLLPGAIQVSDPFHLVQLANQKPTGSVPGQERGPRPPRTQGNPPTGSRKLLVMAQERLDEQAQSRLTGLLAAGDP